MSAGAPATWPEIRDWRKAMRQALIARRLGWAPAQRRARGRAAIERLAAFLGDHPHRVLGIYWPIRGEIDARRLALVMPAGRLSLALPVIVRKGAPLEYWRWWPGAPMQPGEWNIPIPATREVLVPDAVLAPLVGFDGAGYRLGYGGGYFDRTLAAAQPRPRAIGIGYAQTELPTIYPQPHDIRMDVIVTESFTRPSGL